MVPAHQARDGKWACNYLWLDAPADEPLVQVQGCVFAITKQSPAQAGQEATI